MQSCATRHCAFRTHLWHRFGCYFSIHSRLLFCFLANPRRLVYTWCARTVIAASFREIRYIHVLHNEAHDKTHQLLCLRARSTLSANFPRQRIAERPSKQQNFWLTFLIWYRDCCRILLSFTYLYMYLVEKHTTLYLWKIAAGRGFCLASQRIIIIIIISCIRARCTHSFLARLI